MSVGALPFGGVAAAKSLLQASGCHPRRRSRTSTSASVAKLAIVGVWPLLSGSWIVAAPAAGLQDRRSSARCPRRSCRPSAWPLIAVPSRNCALVHTDATVVISLIVTLAGGVAAQHRHQRDGGIVAARLVDGGFAALGDEIQAGIAASDPGPPYESAVGAGLSLSQLPGRARTRGPQGHRRLGDRRAAAEYLTADLARGGRRIGTWRLHPPGYNQSCAQQR